MPVARSLSGATLLCVLEITSAHATFAQQGAALPPIRQLGPRLATTTDSLGTISGIRQLSDGHVFINDVGKHQLLLYDSTLSHATVIADTTESTKKAYGAAPGGILAIRGDTTLFVDPIALAMLVIDPHGAIVGTEAPPRPTDAGAITGIRLTDPAGVDAQNRVVYRGVRISCSASRGCGIGMSPHERDTTGDKTLSVPVYALHDSVAILRGDLRAHVIDTVGFVATPYSPLPKTSMNSDGVGATYTMTLPNPIPIIDDWAVVADGSVAFVRGGDYHIDWVNADGSRSSTPRIAHDWHKLSDSEKTAIIDSAKDHLDSALQVTMHQAARADSIGRAQGQPPRFVPTYVTSRPELSELPDYRPVLSRSEPVIGDADNNLWIRQGAPVVAGGPPPIYDIVNRQGRLIDRIQLPPSFVLAGFGPGVVYLTSREGWGTVVLKYRIR